MKPFTLNPTLLTTEIQRSLNRTVTAKLEVTNYGFFH